MADSFGANLMVGLLSVHEASSKTRSFVSSEHFSPPHVAGSRHVLNV